MAYVSQPAKVAPAGEAWRTYSNRNSLFANDGSHATCSGTFLAACTIFQVTIILIRKKIGSGVQDFNTDLFLSKSGGCPALPAHTALLQMLQL